MIEKNNTTDQLVRLYMVMSRDFEYLGQPDSALFYLKKQNQEARKISSKEALKENISAYLKFKTEEEQKVLESAKIAAETQVKKDKMTMLLSAIIILVLAGAVLLYNYYYHQKMHLVAELERLNISLSSEHAKLRTSNMHLRRFSSVISHDVLSSLDLIISAGNLVSFDKDSKARLLHYFKMSQQISRNLKKYCVDLLQQTKSNYPTVGGLFNPNPVVAEVLHQFQWAFKEKGISVDLEPLPATTLLPVHTTQIFYNLISNMLRHASGQEHPRLFIGENHDEAGNVSWVVADNGPGISTDTWNEIVTMAKRGLLKGKVLD